MPPILGTSISQSWVYRPRPPEKAQVESNERQGQLS